MSDHVISTRRNYRTHIDDLGSSSSILLNVSDHGSVVWVLCVSALAYGLAPELLDAPLRACWPRRLAVPGRSRNGRITAVALVKGMVFGQNSAASRRALLAHSHSVHRSQWG